MPENSSPLGGQRSVSQFCLGVAVSPEVLYLGNLRIANVHGNSYSLVWFESIHAILP